MKEQTVHFVNANAEYQLVYPAALKELGIVQMRKLLDIMCDGWYWEQNERAIRVTKEVAQELFEEVTDKIDMGIGILPQAKLKSLAALKNKYQKILNFITEKE